MVFYDRGVGTRAHPDPWRKLKQDFVTILGLATGMIVDQSGEAPVKRRGRQSQSSIAAPSVARFALARICQAARVLTGLIFSSSFPILILAIRISNSFCRFSQS
jgi:hypothetical protein